MKSGVRGTATLFGLLFLIGAGVWHLYTGTPDLRIDGDAVVLAGVGIVLVALSTIRHESKVIEVASFLAAALATGLSLALVNPGGGHWDMERTLGASFLIVGALGYLILTGTRIVTRLHWALAWATVLVGGAIVYYVVSFTTSYSTA